MRGTGALSLSAATISTCATTRRFRHDSGCSRKRDAPRASASRSTASSATKKRPADNSRRFVVAEELSSATTVSASTKNSPRHAFDCGKLRSFRRRQGLLIVPGGARSIGARGGWAQAGFTPGLLNDRLTAYASFGMDDPRDEDLVSVARRDWRLRNQAYAFSFLYKLSPQLSWGDGVSTLRHTLLTERPADGESSQPRSRLQLLREPFRLAHRHPRMTGQPTTIKLTPSWSVTAQKT